MDIVSLLLTPSHLHSKVVQNLAATVEFVHSIIKSLICCGRSTHVIFNLAKRTLVLVKNDPQRKNPFFFLYQNIHFRVPIESTGLVWYLLNSSKTHAPCGLDNNLNKISVSLKIFLSLL